MMDSTNHHHHRDKEDSGDGGAEEEEEKKKKKKKRSTYPPPPATIRILTLNVWGLKYLSPHRRARLETIAHQIVTSAEPAQIVCLQECWSYADYVCVRRITRPVLPYGKFYHSGIFGAGLVLLSRWRIVEGGMVGYALNGRPSAFWRGDWFVGKGVGWATVRLPDSMAGSGDDRGRSAGGTGTSTSTGAGRRSRRCLEVFNTHLHAPYNEGRKGKDTYSCHRVAQAWEIARLMRRSLERGNLVVACGDFNMVVDGLEWAVIQAQTAGRLRDVWRELHPQSSVGAWIDDGEQGRLNAADERNRGPPTVGQSLTLHGHTCDSVLNTWRWSKACQKDLLNKGKDRTIGPDEQDPRAKRLDYVFLGDGTGEWLVKDARVCMTERHPQLKCSLSDHFAVEAEIVKRPPPSAKVEEEEDSNGVTIRHGQEDKRQREEQHHHYHQHPNNQALYTSILALISSYTARSRLHRRRRLAHFLFSVLITLACFVAVWFAPRNYISFILLLLASLGLMAGTVDGLIGGLFGGSELRALKEWEWEVRNAARLEEEEEEEEEKGEEKVAKAGMMKGGLDGEGAGVGLRREMREEEELEIETGRVRDWWD